MPSFKPQIDSLPWVTIQHARENMIKFPHHGQAEYLIFKRYLNKVNENGYVAFDVHIPNSYPEAHHYDPNSTEFKMFTLLEMRIDGILQFLTNFRIIEIKQKLSPSGVGQVLIYREGFKDKFNFKGPVDCFVVTEQDNIDIRNYASKLGVECKVV